MVTCPAHLSPVCFVLKASTQLPWQQADDACGDAYNGNLVTILDAATDGIIRDLLTNYTDKYGSLSGEVWIGGKREVEGQWRKISGEGISLGRSEVNKKNIISVIKYISIPGEVWIGGK